MNFFSTPAQRYAQSLLARWRDLDRALVPVRELDLALSQHKRLLVAGAPGTGKTTALASLALTHARALAANQPHARIPIFLDASELHPQSLPRLQELSAGLDAKFFQQALGEKRILILIDNLEVLPPDVVRNWIAEFPHVVLAGVRPLQELGLSEFSVPLWRDQDIEKFAQKKFGKRATEFLAALKASGIPRALTSSPMCVSLLAYVWEIQPNPLTPFSIGKGEGGIGLPTRRAELYSAYANAILGQGDETARMLEGVALAIQRGKPAPNEFIAKSKGFLRAMQNQTCDFTHDLWRAYFAARAARLARDLTPIADHLQDPGWREVILFYAGLGDASELVNALIARGDWHFAGEAIAHAKDTQAALNESVTKQLLERAWNGDTRAAVVLGEMQSDVALVAFATQLKDPDPVTRARAAETLGRLQMDRALEYLLPQMRDINADTRDQVVAALGNSLSNRVIEPLLGAFRGDPRVGTVDTRLRVAAAKALGQVGSDKAVPALIVDLQIGEPEVRSLAAQALKRIRSPLMIKPLKGILASVQDADTRQSISDVLASMNGAATDA